ncbi:S24/S26 family peptidase [Massiliimalia timonensis]|uniref:hypothetical protein n=1 Tax=Massiliimalia timonensis TaxID=1987501 RepID=UPI000B8A89B7|nr:hypothetical protein [Massiliimalia timonensis]
MSSKHTATRIFKFLFILFLVISVITSLIYLPVFSSVSKAAKTDSVPTLFGKQYVPMMKENTFDSISAGSIVIIEEAYPVNIQEGDVILYRTPANDTSNEVYPGFSLATVQMIETAEDDSGEIIFHTISGNTTPETAEDLTSIQSTDMYGEATMALNGMGNAFQFVNSTTGLIVLEVLPLSLFVIFLVLFLVFRLKIQDQDEEYEYYDDAEEDLASESENESSKLPLADTDIRSHTVSSQNAGFMVPDIPQEEKHADTSAFELDDIQAPEEHTSEDVAALGIAAASKLAVKTEPEEEEMSFEDLLKETGLENLEEEPKTEEGSDHTMEFDLAKLQEQILNDGNAESNEILNDLDKQISELKEPEDSIMFLLHENSIDVNFRNLISADIEIENHSDGSGFTVKTPKYNASITINISKNK